MILLYPSFLWLFLPLFLLWIKSTKKIEIRIHLLMLMLLVLSLARPVKEGTLQTAPVEAKDIIIALDVSYSMQATDIKPTRYSFAKETINALLKLTPHDNIMLIAFTSNPLLLSPPTTDHTLLSIALDTLNPEYILTKGTSLEKLFKKLASLEGGEKHLILITDGGEEIHIQKLASLLQQTNISLSTLALGTQQGTTITQKDGTLLKDTNGNLIVTRINPLLHSLTQAVKGHYLTAEECSQATAKKLYKTLTQKSHFLNKRQRHYTELYQIPLLLALILFLLLHTRMVKYLILIFAFIGIQVEASFLDSYYLHQAYKYYQADEYNATLSTLKQVDTPSLQGSLAKANSYYKQNKYKQAIKVYKSIHSSSVQTKQLLYYNIANAYAKLSIYSKAKVYYTKALQLGRDKDAQYNLTLIALLLDKEQASVGISHPKSQGTESSKSDTQEDKETNRKEQSSSGSGSGGEHQSKEKNNKKKRLEEASIPQKQPLSSKVYELINKGYIRETRPW